MDYKLALLKRISEETVVLEYRGKEYEIELSEEEKQPLYDNMEEGVFLVPFDVDSQKLMMTVDTKEVYEVFPEAKMLDSELEGSVKNYEEEEE